MNKKLIRKMQTAAGGPIKKFRTRDVNGNWVYMDINTGRTTSAVPESGTIHTNTVNSIGGDVKTKLGRTRIALNQVTSYNNRQYKVHNYADTRTRLQLKNQDVVLDKQGEPEVVQADYTPTLEAPMKIVSPEFDLLTLGRLAITSAYNATKPTINVMADTTPEVKSATTLSLEQIEKAFELARLWHLNRINSPGYTNRALRAGFTEEEIPLLQLQLVSLINRLKLFNPEKLFKKVIMKNNYNGKASAGYWKTINNEGKLLLGIRFDDPNMSYDDAVSTFVHEFGHGATFGLKGDETTGYMKLLSDLFPLLTRAVKYNKTLYPEVNENIVTQVMPKVGNNARYYADPSEMLSRGYEFMRDYANNFFKLKNSEGLTTQNVIDNAANTRINSKIFRALTGNLGAFNFLKYALGTAAPIGLGYDLMNDNENQLQLQYQKLGGKMNTLELLKNGSGIHIKKKNRGKFTEYCGGKVTDECIRKAKASGNSTLVKRATFAANARKWKHKEGGIIKALEGTKTSWWLKAGNFLNSDAGKGILNLGSSLISGIGNASKAIDFGQDFDNATNATVLAMLKKQYAKNKNLGMQYALLYINYLNQMNPDQHFGEIDKQMLSELFAKLLVDEDDINEYKLLRAEEKALLMLAIQGSGSGFGDVLSQGLGLLGNYLGNKKTTNSTTQNLSSNSTIGKTTNSITQYLLSNNSTIGKSTNPYMNTNLGGFVNNPTNKYFWAPSVKG